MQKKLIIEEIRRTARANGGKPLGKARFEAETGIAESDWAGKHWVRWSDAISEAGFEPNVMQGAYEEEFVIGKLVEFIQELGHFPVRNELRIKARGNSDFPSDTVFRRLGRNSQLARKVITYCQERDGFDDVIEICEPLASSTYEPTASDPEKIGYVYLMKSGKFYKIGRSNAVGRREYELGTKLPEEVKTPHTIKTDDPEGIEAYWHRRFAERRKRGEWFDLTASDVRAFKRRRFM